MLQKLWTVALHKDEDCIEIRRKKHRTSDWEREGNDNA
jgi:hypothetical protein